MSAETTVIRVGIVGCGEVAQVRPLPLVYSPHKIETVDPDQVAGQQR